MRFELPPEEPRSSDPTVERWREQLLKARTTSLIWDVYSEICLDALRGDTGLFNLIIGRAGHTQPPAVFKILVTMLGRNLLPDDTTVTLAFRIMWKAQLWSDILAAHRLLSQIFVLHNDTSIVAVASAVLATSGPHAVVGFLTDRMDSWTTPNGAKLHMPIYPVLKILKLLSPTEPALLEMRLNLAERALRFYLAECRVPGSTLAVLTERLTFELVEHRPEVVRGIWEQHFPREKNLLSVRTLGKLCANAFRCGDADTIIKIYNQQILRTLEPASSTLNAALVVLARGRDTPQFEQLWRQFPTFTYRIFTPQVYALALEHYAINVSGDSLHRATHELATLPAHRLCDTIYRALISVYFAHGKYDEAIAVLHEKLTEPLSVSDWSRWIRLALMHKMVALAFRIYDEALGVLRYSDGLYDELEAAADPEASARWRPRILAERQLEITGVEAEGDKPFDSWSLEGLAEKESLESDTSPSSQSIPTHADTSDTAPLFE